ncbi:MucR family transcriptional regulator [Methylobacterium sp. 092160098-2]|uniref:MucR family transcriptional regulator n=1 Tax=Methylobacterium sp. 092160098-2 TaxID=3025129 RepID=UPI002381B4D0|nr:MucR family transcriptional regulator [Methylobacterium sp. 092160098-2]MDE4916077.1 MucR family transcriptional regulator [Methylobacterium sp. 092160098-2]
MGENAVTMKAEAVDHTGLTAELVSAYVTNNSVPVSELPALIASTHAALTGLCGSSTPAAPEVEKPTPAQIRKSITHEALISFEDGKPYKTLKRHLAKLGLTPEAYREKWGLPRDYPTTAPSYSEQRSALAKSLGLGQQRRQAGPKSPEPATNMSVRPKRARRPRKAKDAAEA